MIITAIMLLPWTMAFLDVIYRIGDRILNAGRAHLHLTHRLRQYLFHQPILLRGLRLERFARQKLGQDIGGLLFRTLNDSLFLGTIKLAELPCQLVEWTTVLEMQSREDEPLLVGWYSFLVLDLRL